MAHLIDADKIRQEIKRRIANFNTLHNTAVLRKDTDGVERIDCALGQLQHLLSFIYTLESEKPIEVLEKEIQKYLESKGVGYGGWIDGWKDEDLREIACHFAKWGAEHLKK